MDGYTITLPPGATFIVKYVDGAAQICVSAAGSSGFMMLAGIKLGNEYEKLMAACRDLGLASSWVTESGLPGVVAHLDKGERPLLRIRKRLMDRDAVISTHGRVIWCGRAADAGAYSNRGGQSTRRLRAKRSLSSRSST